MEFLGQGGGFKTICRVKRPEMKKNIIGDTFFDFTTYLVIIYQVQSLCVCHVRTLSTPPILVQALCK
jgi:hypothetical protein